MQWAGVIAFRLHKIPAFSVISSMVQLFEGDCLEVMGQIPDASVDMVLCDLPYEATSCKWDSQIDLPLLWKQYKRLLRPNRAIVLHCTQPFTTILISSNLPWFKYCWVWEKNRVGGIFNAKNMPLKSHEDIAVFSEGTTANCSESRMPYYPQGLVACEKVGRNSRRSGTDTIGNRPSRDNNSYVQTATNYPKTVLRFSSEVGLHPTQKPVSLEEYLVQTYTNVKEVVLDNTMGSGTTGVACINAGRSFIGIEKESQYFEVAEERIVKAHQEKTKKAKALLRDSGLVQSHPNQREGQPLVGNLGEPSPEVQV